MKGYIMKALFTVTANEATALVKGVNTISDVVSGKELITGEMVHAAKKNANEAEIHHFAGGWAQFRGEKNEENSTAISDYTIEVSAESEATVLAINAMVKMITYFAPIITPLISMWINAKAIGKNWKNFADAACSEFRKAFHKPSTYATVVIFSDEADVAACAIVEKDGYGNEPHIVESVEITEHVGIDMLTRLWKKAESRVDTPTEYYPHAEYTFDNIEDARKNMEKSLRSVRADYEGMQRARREREEENKYCLSKSTESTEVKAVNP
ncbi:MAG: hypothetical protein NC489_08560 [Ruminococcus flavefaciens]|nr:hypothetical protein [Ruminococcus flavefaciens]